VQLVLLLETVMLLLTLQLQGLRRMQASRQEAIRSIHHMQLEQQ
jgi:hypothetical protein